MTRCPNCGWSAEVTGARAGPIDGPPTDMQRYACTNPECKTAFAVGCSAAWRARKAYRPVNYDLRPLRQILAPMPENDEGPEYDFERTGAGPGTANVIAEAHGWDPDRVDLYLRDLSSLPVGVLERTADPYGGCDREYPLYYITKRGAWFRDMFLRAWRGNDMMDVMRITASPGCGDDYHMDDPFGTEGDTLAEESGIPRRRLEKGLLRLRQAGYLDHTAHVEWMHPDEPYENLKKIRPRAEAEHGYSLTANGSWLWNWIIDWKLWRVPLG